MKEPWKRYRRAPFVPAFTDGLVRVRDVQNREILQAERLVLTGRNDDNLRREAAILRELSHENILRLHACFENNGQIYFIKELCSNSNMLTHLTRLADDNSHLTPNMLQSYLHQLCSALAYCHSRGVMHRRLSLSALSLFDDNTKLKLVGFRGARLVPDKEVDSPRLTLPTSTLLYRAPEVMLGDASYGTPIDMWSVGLLFDTMATGRHHFSTSYELEECETNEIVHLYCLFQTLGTPTEATWPAFSELPHYSGDACPVWPRQPFSKRIRQSMGEEALHLLGKLLTCNPAKRISAKEALDHPYFCGVVNTSNK